MRIQFIVHGKPEPQGSSRAFVVKGKPIITSTNKSLSGWRQLVQHVAQEHAHMFEGPVNIHMTFHLPRPKSLPKKVKAHIKKPDLDKLVRAICDALTGIMWHDDSQVVSLYAQKVYCGPPNGPAVVIGVGEAHVSDTASGM